MATYTEIEARNKEDIMEILDRNNVSRGLRGYSLAKKLCFEGQFINNAIYDKQIGWIAEYLGI